jgi:hypothetical protein
MVSDLASDSLIKQLGARAIQRERCSGVPSEVQIASDRPSGNQCRGVREV